MSMNVLTVCDLDFIVFRTSKWATRITTPTIDRLGDAIEQTPEQPGADHRGGRLITIRGLARRQPGQQDDLSDYRG